MRDSLFVQRFGHCPTLAFLICRPLTELVVATRSATEQLQELAASFEAFEKAKPVRPPRSNEPFYRAIHNQRRRKRRR